MTTLLIGCDPEVFARNSVTGAFVSAHGLIPGSKQEPHVVPLGAVQVDGMAFEFNTDPASTRDEFVNNVTGVYKTLESMLPSGLTLAPGVPVAKFTTDVYKAQPLEALELGCEPDYNAYTGEENPRPDAADVPMRTAAGHIHIGFTEDADIWDEVHFMECCDLVLMLDVMVGLDSLNYDKDVERRELYGKAGAFRCKSYGLEYRVLSNAWLADEKLIERVYDRVIDTTQLFLDGVRFPEELYQEAQLAIDSSDFATAKRILAEVSNFL